MLYSAPKHRRPGGTLYRAVVREVAAPAALALCALTLVLLTQDLIGFSELVINRGLAARSVAWLAFYELVPRVSLSLPFACLVGCLVGLGRMGADRELLVLEASGISSPRLIGPVARLQLQAPIIGARLPLLPAPLRDPLVRQLHAGGGPLRRPHRIRQRTVGNCGAGSGSIRSGR